MLASGHYAMLDDGMGFSLVPWKPVIEQRLGQWLAATVRGGGESDGRETCRSRAYRLGCLEFHMQGRPRILRCQRVFMGG